jgi:hypothetical protein
MIPAMTSPGLNGEAWTKGVLGTSLRDTQGCHADSSSKP